MNADRYLKIVLTVIALELGWLGIRDVAPVSAQQQSGPMPVVVTGFKAGTREYMMLPVVVVGGLRSIPGVTDIPGVEMLSVRVPEPVKFDNRQPITVQTGTKPLLVDAIVKPGARPGE
jgi:hypothetical protein